MYQKSIHIHLNHPDIVLLHHKPNQYHQCSSSKCCLDTGTLLVLCNMHHSHRPHQSYLNSL